MHVKEDRSSRTPMVLLPYQQRWCADLSPIKIAEKSRRIGLTWCEAADSALLAASDSGMDVWYIGYNKDMAMEFIEDAADWSRHYSHAAAAVEEFIFVDKGKGKGEEKSINAFRIRYASGHKVVALSSRPSNLRGKQGKVILDEAAFHESLKELIKAAVALLMWGGRVVIISTHDGDANPFNELIQDVVAKKKPYSLHKITLDDALADGLYQRICLRQGLDWSQDGQGEWREQLIQLYGEDNAEEELFCIPSQGTGTFLTLAMLEAIQNPDIPIFTYKCRPEFVDYPEHIREGETLEWCEEHILPIVSMMPENFPCYFGEDFARNGDLSVQWPIQEQVGLKFKPPFILELRNVPFEQQKQILFYMCDRLPRFRGGALDARGNGQFLAEVARQKYGPDRIIEVMTSESWYREAMPRFKKAIEDKETQMPKDGDTLDDHRAIKMTKGVAKVPDRKAKGRDGLGRHGDSGIAHCLALYAARGLAGVGDIEYESVSKSRFAATKGAW